MKNKIVLSFVALLIVVLLAINTVSAFPGWFGEDISEEEKEAMKETMENIREAIENQDYETWYELVEARLTEENFNKIVERHEKMSEMQELREELEQAWEDEDYEKVKELRAELAENMPKRNLENFQNIERRPARKSFLERLQFWK